MQLVLTQTGPDVAILQGGIGPIVTLDVGPGGAPAALADAQDGGMPVITDDLLIERGGALQTIALPALRGAVNLVDYGGLPGGADCTAALTAAIAAAAVNGREVFIPGGDYWFASPIVASNQQVAIRGQGKGVTRLHVAHTGIALDIAPASVLQPVSIRDLTFWAENEVGPTAAAVRVTYPVQSSSYESVAIDNVAVSSYPNSVNGLSPFPQTWTRGFILVNCWKPRLRDVGWVGAPSAAGATSSAFLEISGCYDTRVHGAAAQYGGSMVIQTGYCEGLYLVNPVVINCDYVFTQSALSGWSGYNPSKVSLLGLWMIGGELNTALGTVQANSLTLGLVVGCDISRNSGPSGAEVMFQFTDVSNFAFGPCNWVGNPGNADIAIQFSAAVNSSGNTILGGHWEGMATAIKIIGSSGTVGLYAVDLHLSNLPLSTAIIDPTPASNGNTIKWRAPAGSNYPSGTASPKDHVLCGTDGLPIKRFKTVAQAIDYITEIAASAGGSTTCVLQTNSAGISIAPAGGLFLPNLPTSSAGLSAGQVWRNGNVLNIV